MRPARIMIDPLGTISSTHSIHQIKLDPAGRSPDLKRAGREAPLCSAGSSRDLRFPAQGSRGGVGVIFPKVENLRVVFLRKW